MKLLRSRDFIRASKPPRIAVAIVSTSRCKHEHCDDACAVASIGVQVFKSISACDVKFGLLTVLDTADTDSKNKNRAVVRLKLIHRNDLIGISDHSNCIYISPLAASNLGIAWSFDNDTVQGCLEPLFVDPIVASRVVLRPIGNLHDSSKHTLLSPNNKQGNNIESQKLSLPGADTLLQPSNLVSVYSMQNGEVHCFEVLRCDPPNQDTTTSQIDMYVTSRQTIVELDVSPLPQLECGILRLPPLSSLQQYHTSSICAADQTEQVDSVSLALSPLHPNQLEVSKALLGCSMAASLDENILHVKGTQNEHDVVGCIRLAAQAVGMRHLPIRGLSAFGIDEGCSPTLGSLQDTLNGLESVFKLIRRNRLEPCVVHLHGLDDAVIGGADKASRDEQQSRMWRVMENELGRYRTRPASSVGASSRMIKRRFCPPVVVILSTREELKNGPFLQKMVHPSISMDLPSREYTKEIWKIQGPCSNQLYDRLVGRGFSDILWLSRKVENEVRTASKNSSASQDQISRDTFLDKYLLELDQNHRDATSAVSKISNVRWKDIGGHSKVRREIQDMIEFPLKHPRLFPKTGAMNGILLYGPPGTGKTLVAKAVATECGLPFMSIKGPELLGSYIGESEANVREVFISARKAAEANTPQASIIFFDELDSLAPRRGGVGDGGGVMERVVATLFAEIDKQAAAEAYIFVIGATNRPDLLDPGLLRRLNRLVYMGVADNDKDRAQILEAQIRKLNLDGNPAEVARQVIEQAPKNLTGADFSAVVSTSLMAAVRNVCNRIDDEAVRSECSIEDVMQKTGVVDLRPKISAADLISACLQVIPSVSEDDIQRYSKLKLEFG